MDSFIQGAIDAQEERIDRPRPDNVADAELEALLSSQKAKIKVIGAGGAGCNTINRISEVGILGTETIAVNTDAQDLKLSKRRDYFTQF